MSVRDRVREREREGEERQMLTREGQRATQGAIIHPLLSSYLLQAYD